MKFANVIYNTHVDQIINYLNHFQSFCRSHHGHLAEVGSEMEHVFLKNHLKFGELFLCFAVYKYMYKYIVTKLFQ